MRQDSTQADGSVVLAADAVSGAAGAQAVVLRAINASSAKRMQRPLATNIHVDEFVDDVVCREWGGRSGGCGSGPLGNCWKANYDNQEN